MKGVIMLLREYCLVAFLALISNNLISQECSKLASILASNKPYHLAKVYQDSLIVSVKSKISENVILSAFKELDLHRIESFVESENANCKKVMKKFKFIHEGTMKDCELKNGKFISLDIYSRIASDY